MPLWIGLLADSKTLEEGGRIDYTLADKISDLKALLEGIALTGWSSGHVLPHLQQLATIIANLEKQLPTAMISATSLPLVGQGVSTIITPQYTLWPFHNGLHNGPASHQATSSGIGRFDTSESSIQEIPSSSTTFSRWSLDCRTNSTCGAWNSGMNDEEQDWATFQTSNSEYVDQLLTSIGMAGDIGTGSASY